MTTVYVTDELVDQLRRAQILIHRHLARCPACATNRHCHERTLAENLFARYGLLPRRMPGLTRRTTAIDGMPE
jgi:hypothetical protein